MSETIVRCVQCGQANRIPEGAAGKTIVCGKCHSRLSGSSSGEPVRADDANFTALISEERPVVVDFWAAWCGPCRMIAPAVEQLASERPDVTFAKMNVDENHQTAAKYRVTGIPTLIFFRNGTELGRVVGAVGKPQIEQAIRQYFAL